jgi:predicted ribosome quality control (RQC) complex YloA/Tae2 family protein
VHETEGELLKTVLARIHRGDASVDVVDWEGNPRTLTLDATKDAKANLEDRFKRARRARASAERTTPRLAEAKARLEVIEGARASLSTSTIEEARALLARPATASSARRTAAKSGTRQAWRSFRCSNDVVVRVGRGARDNDALVKSARGNDVWLHARNHQGAHVIIPASAVRATGDVDPELLLDAAHLAAHFSSARGEARVDVQHTHVKNLKKPGAGAPAGLVHVAKESVLHLRVDGTRLQALLAREVAA